MLKKYWKTLFITSIVTLLPIALGLLLWDRLPEQLPSHWNVNGEVDGWSSKAFAVFGMPLILLGVQWLCALVTCADPKRKNHTAKVMHLVLWIIPVLSVFLNGAIYLAALGEGVPVEWMTPVLLGLLFVILGNYMPKCQINYTIGIKLPWTLNSEENWNRTHRLAGWVWVVGGLILMFSGLVGGVWLMIAIALVMTLIPVIYSYTLYKKGI